MKHDRRCPGRRQRNVHVERKQGTTMIVKAAKSTRPALWKDSLWQRQRSTTRLRVRSGSHERPRPYFSGYVLIPHQKHCGLVLQYAIYASSIVGGGCLFKITGTALSEAALSAFHSKFQKPSPRGEAQNDLPTLPPSLSPFHSRALPKNMKPVVV
jgi:hypothetical protein